MVNGVNMDSAAVARSSEQMGELLMNANEKQMGYIQDTLKVRAETVARAPTLPGLGEKVDKVA